MTIAPMHLILAGGLAFVAVTFWVAHRSRDAKFDAFDLVMEDGKASKIAVAYMLVLAVSTWVIIDQQIDGKLSEGTLGLWLGAWVGPLVAKVVFGKDAAPATTSTITMTKTTTEAPTEPDKP